MITYRKSIPDLWNMLKDHILFISSDKHNDSQAELQSFGMSMQLLVNSRKVVAFAFGKDFCLYHWDFLVVLHSKINQI